VVTARAKPAAAAAASDSGVVGGDGDGGGAEGKFGDDATAQEEKLLAQLKEVDEEAKALKEQRMAQSKVDGGATALEEKFKAQQKVDDDAKALEEKLMAQLMVGPGRHCPPRLVIHHIGNPGSLSHMASDDVTVKICLLILWPGRYCWPDHLPHCEPWFPRLVIHRVVNPGFVIHRNVEVDS